MALLEKAKVFMSGRSQAVRIPAQFRFSKSEVYIRRDPKNGDLILSQAPTSLEEILAALQDHAVDWIASTPARYASLAEGDSAMITKLEINAVE